MKVTCSVEGCVHNERGACEANSIYVSAYEDGWPKCMTALRLDDLQQPYGPDCRDYPAKGDMAAAEGGLR